MVNTDDRSRFRIEFYLSRLTERVSTEPLLIPDKLLDQAWNMISDFVIDVLDELEPDATDERYREAFIEICYRLIFREMFTLNTMPKWEKSDLARLGTRQTGARVRKRGSYDDSDWS